MKIFLALCLLFFSTMASSASLDKIVVFGDSLSDNGNLYEYMKHDLPFSPPYFKGRFTNGPVWVELLTQLYYPNESGTHLLDYAFGGAGVSEDIDDDGEEVLFTLRREVDSYLLSHQDKADDSSLYVVWIGSNNYLAVPDDMDQTVSDVILGISHQLQRLADKGARHIMVVNVPDLGRTPAARDFDAVDALTLLSVKHNLVLEKTMQDLKVNYPAVHWFSFDVNQILDDMMRDSALYGFTNITDTCYEEMVDTPSSNSILHMVSTVKPVAMLDNACDGYLFFDPVHPSEHAHEIMAARTKLLLDKEGIEFK